MKFLSNLPIEDLTKENDYLGVIEKGDMIVSLLKSGNINFEEIKMFALYGNWGSGKSTLMKYVQKVLKDNFKTFYFDAWQYENGKDLSFSLLQFMIDEGLSEGEKAADSFLKTAENILVGTAKSISINLPGIKIQPKELLEEIEKQPKPSFHQEIQSFKQEFLGLESLIKQESKKDYNIVFIDDLDRCEPEKVLDLLSEIKLFFNYGERTVFFFGVDEKAVQAAIQTKYRDVVKSNEYLEKIFDLSFNMPSKVFLRKLTGQVFSDNTIQQMRTKVGLNYLVSQLFEAIGIDNPRKIKKILNKYFLLLTANENSRLVNDKGLVYKLKSEDSPIYIIYSLYLITLNMFSETEFDDFGSSHSKSQILNNVSNDSMGKIKDVPRFTATLEDFLGQINLEQSLDTIFKEARLSSDPGHNASKLLYLSIPTNLRIFHHELLGNLESFKLIKVLNDSLSINFSFFILEHLLPYYEVNWDDEISLSIKDFKLLIKQLI